MNSYYLTLVLKSEMDEKVRKSLLGAMVKKLTGEDGKVGKEDLWGEKVLAYPIKKHTAGYIAHYEVTADPKNAKTLDKALKVEEDILRFLLVRV